LEWGILLFLLSLHNFDILFPLVLCNEPLWFLLPIVKFDSWGFPICKWPWRKKLVQCRSFELKCKNCILLCHGLWISSKILGFECLACSTSLDKDVFHAGITKTLSGLAKNIKKHDDPVREPPLSWVSIQKLASYNLELRLLLLLRKILQHLVYPSIQYDMLK
jgi:hypothetical protein